MYISNNRFRIAQLNEGNLLESAKLLAQIFFSENKVWGAAQLDFQEVQQYMIDKARQKLQWQNEMRQTGVISQDTFLNFVYLDQNDKVIAVWTNIEMMQYLTKKSKVILPKFQIVQQYGYELQKSIQASDKIPGRCVYGVYIVVDPKHFGDGVAMLFWLDGSHYLNSKGFRVLYARASNIKSFSYMMKFGAQRTAVLKPSLNGVQVYLWFIKWNTDPIDYVRHIADQVIQKGNKKAKL